MRSQIIKRPSLFYQFLGGNETTTAFDTYSFCEVLGPKEANKQLRRHWDTWVTEDIIQELADSGAVNSLRLPVGDFQYKAYGPYSKYSSISHTIHQNVFFVSGSKEWSIDVLISWFLLSHSFCFVYRGMFRGIVGIY
jgi:aryl-phospho-beta-D-glucosidase BglC (GH1 family)